MKATYSQRLIKLADLNHHQTFFAGRCSEWFLESSYFAVAQYVDTKDTVLLVLHGIDFKFPIFAGDIVTFESKVISVGRSTLTVYTKMYRSREPEKSLLTALPPSLIWTKTTIPVRTASPLSRKRRKSVSCNSKPWKSWRTRSAVPRR